MRNLHHILCAAALLLFFNHEAGHCVKGSDLYPGLATGTEPWYTGTLLSPSGYVVPKGYVNFEPYLVVSDTFAFYNSHWRAESIPDIWTIEPIVLTWFGLTEKIDFFIWQQFNWSETRGHSAIHYDDLPAGIDFQLLEEKRGSMRPAIKLVLRELFPTGKYQHLDPKKGAADIAGFGSYVTSVGLVFARLTPLMGHFLSSRLFLNYSIPTSVRVKGFNSYGGGYGTDGRVNPGNFFTTILGLEYSITRNWVFSLDVQNIYTKRTTFKGIRGIGQGGVPAIIGTPSSLQLSLAPAIEYNFNESLGIIGGVWFTVAGRNASDFVSGVLAINWYTKTSKSGR